MKQTEYMKGWSHAGWLVFTITFFVVLFFFLVGTCNAQTQTQHLSVIAKKNTATGGVDDSTLYLSDFSVDSDSFKYWSGVTVEGNIDGIGGYNDVLRMTADNTTNYIRTICDINTAWLGDTVNVYYEYYIPSTNTYCDGWVLTWYITTWSPTQTTLDTWTSVAIYDKILVDSAYDHFRVYFQDGGVSNSTYNGDVVYIKNFHIVDANP